ncbi:hypothetical protein MXD81_37070 [Microbacteriaceae bacterium K1510]|nr:hypothetical protein [Microbacteriaceae bacterium K1510]
MPDSDLAKPTSISINKLGRAHVRRRSLLEKILLAPLMLLGKDLSVASAQTTSSPSEEELRPFREIAARKGAKFVIGPTSQFNAQANAQVQMHLDMDMVRASIGNAIERTKKQNQKEISDRLERLLANGTAAQQVEFVLGSGDKYFFPEDIEKWAQAAEADKLHSFGVVCNTVCYTICKCSCWFKDCTQECSERCRDIFC